MEDKLSDKPKQYKVKPFKDKNKKQDFEILSTKRLEDKIWEVTFKSNIKKHKGSYSFVFEWIEREDDTFEANLGEVYSSSSEEVNQRLSDLRYVIFQSMFDEESLYTYLLVDAGFYVQDSTGEYNKVPKGERKPFNYVTDIKNELLEEMPGEIRDNINRTMRIHTKSFFNEHSWKLSDFGGELALSIKLYKNWVKSSHTRNSIWTKENYEIELFGDFPHYMGIHLINHAKQLFVEKNKEWSFEDNQENSAVNVLNEG
ncbi:hypothetical protein U8V72_21100 [Priestia filamentosa]|uniref:hypothetical protein n=1 Tax=Priestia filamentosa TaxID=1402861 RepID=UPI00397CD9EE